MRRTLLTAGLAALMVLAGGAAAAQNMVTLDQAIGYGVAATGAAVREAPGATAASRARPGSGGAPSGIFSVGAGVHGNYLFYDSRGLGSNTTYSYTSMDFGAFGRVNANFTYALADLSLVYAHRGYIESGSQNDRLGAFVSLLGKYPFDLGGGFTAFPLLGVGYELELYSKWNNGRPEYFPGLLDWSALSLRGGGGLSYGLSERLRLEARLLYDYYLYSKNHSERYASYSRHGPGLSLGIAYLF